MRTLSVTTSPARLTSPETSTETPAVIKYYLVAYNLLSALGWGYVLVGAVAHLLDPAAKRGAHLIWIQQYLPSVFSPPATTFDAVGWRTTVVQTFAVLEVVHSLLRWVRSPLPTVSMQVASRLYIVWGITSLFPNVRPLSSLSLHVSLSSSLPWHHVPSTTISPATVVLTRRDSQTHAHPAFTSMVLSWAATEVIRYVFYACTLLGSEPYPLLWLRYTAFYVLYITGASSEAALIFSTLPARLSDWGLHDLARGALFCIWWPCTSLILCYFGETKS